MSRYFEPVIYAVALYLLLPSIAAAEFAFCGKSDAELQLFRSGKTYFELAAAYVEDCAAESQLLSEGQVFLERIRAADDANRANAVRQTVLLLVSQFDEQFRDSQGADARPIDAMREELVCEMLAMESQEALDEADCGNNLFSSDGTVPLQKWWPRVGVGPVFDESFVTPFSTDHAACDDKQYGSDSVCDKAFDNEFLPILEYQSVMHGQVRPIANQKPAEQITAYYSDSHERWKSYLSDTGFQYPWELTFNRWKRGGFEEIARREEAPTTRFIIAHPTVAIAYSEESPDGDQIRLMGVLKLFGYKWWQFSGNRAKRVWGISATATVADMPGVSDGGYGVMLEYNQFALGWSSHGGDDVISVSFDLGSLLSDRPDTLQGWLKKLED